MANNHSVGDLLEFLSHASERGLMPAATAQSLAVAVRNVFGVLGSSEGGDVRQMDIPAVVKRFENKRARDFAPSSLREYGRRVHRAVDLYLKWREDPANFSVKTRTTASARRKERNNRTDAGPGVAQEDAPEEVTGGGYASAFPIRPGKVVSIMNIPSDLTSGEAERLANFIRMLAVDS